MLLPGVLLRCSSTSVTKWPNAGNRQGPPHSDALGLRRLRVRHHLLKQRNFRPLGGMQQIQDVATQTAEHMTGPGTAESEVARGAHEAVDAMCWCFPGQGLGGGGRAVSV